MGAGSSLEPRGGREEGSRRARPPVAVVGAAAGGGGRRAAVCGKCGGTRRVRCWSCRGTGEFLLWGRREVCPTCCDGEAEGCLPGERPCPECAEDRSGLNAQLLPPVATR